MPDLHLQAITFQEACWFVERHHSHHDPPVGWTYGVAVNDGQNVVGVAMVGRPVARGFDDGTTLEVTRCCTDGTKNVASKLYAACWRVAKNLGYRRLITYTLKREEGTSLRAVQARILHEVRGRSWDTPSRPRVDRHPTVDKMCWVIGETGDAPRLDVDRVHDAGMGTGGAQVPLPLDTRDDPGEDGT